MAKSFWRVHAHGVSEAHVHGVPMARVHGLLWKRTKSFGSVVISKFEAKFDGLKGGEDGRGVDPLAKHQT